MVAPGRRGRGAAAGASGRPATARRAASLVAVLLPLLAALHPAAAVNMPTPVPPEVAARWSLLNPKKWNLTMLEAAVELLQPPTGFVVDLYYPRALVNNARSLAVSGRSAASGGPVIVYVSSRLANRTYALVDANGDGTADSKLDIVTGLDTPQGVDWHKGDLYIAGWGSKGEGVVWRARGIDDYALQGKPFPREKLEVLTRQLPADRWHGERYMRFGPDGLLYIAVGAPCDTCVERRSPQNITFSSIYSFNVSQGDKGLKLYARGIRNAVGMDWHPDRPWQMFFTENGRDHMGDDLPDCKLLEADRPGYNFGFPFCHTRGQGSPYLRDPGPGTPLRDPNLNRRGRAMDCDDPAAYRRPVQALGPHTAPLGLRFYRWEVGRSWPPGYDRTLIIAQHGSWDRSSKIGYRLVAVRLKPQPGPAAAGPPPGGAPPPEVESLEDLLTGFVAGPPGAPKEKQLAWGRPVDVAQLPDGSLLISDDAAHTLYRLHYDPKAANAGATNAGGAAAAARKAFAAGEGSKAPAALRQANFGGPLGGAACRHAWAAMALALFLMALL